MENSNWWRHLKIGQILTVTVWRTVEFIREDMCGCNLTNYRPQCQRVGYVIWFFSVSRVCGFPMENSNYYRNWKSGEKKSMMMCSHFPYWLIRELDVKGLFMSCGFSQSYKCVAFFRAMVLWLSYGKWQLMETFNNWPETCSLSMACNGIHTCENVWLSLPILANYRPRCIRVGYIIWLSSVLRVCGFPMGNSNYYRNLKSGKKGNHGMCDFPQS